MMSRPCTLSFSHTPLNNDIGLVDFSIHKDDPLPSFPLFSSFNNLILPPQVGIPDKGIIQP